MTPEQAQEVINALAAIQASIRDLQTVVSVVGFFGIFALAAYVFWFTIFRE